MDAAAGHTRTDADGASQTPRFAGAYDRVGKEWRNYAAALRAKWEGKFAKRGEGETARVDQGAEVDAELLDDVALHLHYGDLQQHLLATFDGDHVDDLPALRGARLRGSTAAIRVLALSPPLFVEVCVCDAVLVPAA